MILDTDLSASPRARGVADAAETLQPLAAPMPRAMAITGLSRSAIYRAAGRGDIRLLKVGKRAVLVDMVSARAFLAGLPEARIMPPKPAA